MTRTIIRGEAIAVMQQMADESIDAIVTDPPYGLGFMGKKWDDLPPGEDWARECLRVLKPGGHLLAFGGTRTWHRLAVAVEDAGFEIRDSIAWMHGQGFPKGKSQLKPAFEPIVLARRPFRGSERANLETHGTGALNVEACRLETGEDTRRNARGGDNGLTGSETFKIRERRAEDKEQPSGRWPANVVLDEDQAAALDAQSGVSKSCRAERGAGKGPTATYGEWGTLDDTTRGHNDQGGASRFFYCAKAPKNERPVVDGVAHPTVKPLSLMRWLVRLVTPTGGTVLDPFAGSGTTVEAALLEGFSVIAIEREAEYLPLIRARIARVA